MNRKQLIILLILGVVIGGAGYVALERKESSFKSEDSALGQKLLPDFPINDVAQITIQHQTNQLHLARQEEAWTVRERHNYPADFSAISEFLRKVWELKTVQAVKVGPSQLGRLELLEPGPDSNTGTLVEFKDKSGKNLRSLLLGKKYLRESQDSSLGGGEWPVGRYVLAPDKPAQAWVISEPFSNIEPKPEPWLNKDFFKVEKLESVSLTSTNATNSWKLTRETESGEWKLADPKEGEELDTGKTGSFNYLLSSPTFNDVLPPATPVSVTGLDQPVTARLETFDNFDYAVNISSKTNEENFYLTVKVTADIPRERTPGKDEKPEDKEKLDKEHKEKVEKLEDKLKQEQRYGDWIYLVSKWTVDSLIKDRKELLAEKKPEPAADTDAGAKPSAPPELPKPPGQEPPPLPPLPREPKTADDANKPNP